jgi:hypothetical protein
VIVFDLQCLDGGCPNFEAWFRSTADYEQQVEAGLVECPICRSDKIGKAPMAPRVPKKSSNDPIHHIAAVQAAMLKDSRWVGDRFVETARAIHAGDIPAEQVHGSATLEQAKSLLDDGVPVAPLPLPVTPPNQLN